jgi:hypothetical protein
MEEKETEREREKRERELMERIGFVSFAARLVGLFTHSLKLGVALNT